jgi:predicted transcriptional regulator
MDDWIEEDVALLAGGEPVPRVFDQRVLQEPIRYLNPSVPLGLAPGATVREAVRLMREHRVGCVLIVEGERLVGILTERDLLLKMETANLDAPVRQFMTLDPEVLGPDDPIAYALNKMSVGGFRHVPLVDRDERPVGIISVKDIVDYLVDFFPNDVLTVAPDPARAQVWRGRDGG